MKHSTINFFGKFSNEKIEKRGNNFIVAMAKHEKTSVHAISKNWADAIGNYRMLDNENVSIDGIKEGIIDDCIRKAKCSHALAIQDTTQLNYEKQRGRIQHNTGLGVIGDNKSLGYFLHPSMVLNADTQDIYGFSSIIHWIRKEGRESKKEGQRKLEDIEEKESYRWIDSVVKSRELLQNCDIVTYISDREGDIYELFAITPNEKTYLLIRSKDNRLLKEGKLFEYLSSQPVVGRYEIIVKGDIRKKRVTRKAAIEVKIAKVTILKPKKLKKNDKYADEVEMYAIEAKEIETTVPENEKPIHWRLLTTHPVTSFEQARLVIYWYSLRWNIEQFFRLLQKEGLKIESSELEIGTNIIKLGIFALGATLKIMQLLLASKGENTQPIEQVFTENEIDFINDLSKEYDGKTEKQKNKNKPRTLKWASWIIARIGGWKGYESQRPPGPITFFTGLHDFYLMYQGWMLAKRE